MAVEVPITPTLGVLRAALNELFDLEGEQYYGESGLYNALYQSHLRIDDLAVVNGEAVIKLKGELVMGGECDIPRVEETVESARAAIFHRRPRFDLHQWPVAGRHAGFAGVSISKYRSLYTDPHG